MLLSRDSGPSNPHPNSHSPFSDRSLRAEEREPLATAHSRCSRSTSIPPDVTRSRRVPNLANSPASSLSSRSSHTPESVIHRPSARTQRPFGAPSRSSYTRSSSSSSLASSASASTIVAPKESRDWKDTAAKYASPDKIRTHRCAHCPDPDLFAKLTAEPWTDILRDARVVIFFLFGVCFAVKVEWIFGPGKQSAGWLRKKEHWHAAFLAYFMLAQIPGWLSPRSRFIFVLDQFNQAILWYLVTFDLVVWLLYRDELSMGAAMRYLLLTFLRMLITQLFKLTREKRLAESDVRMMFCDKDEGRPFLYRAIDPNYVRFGAMGGRRGILGARNSNPAANMFPNAGLNPIRRLAVNRGPSLTSPVSYLTYGNVLQRPRWW